MILSQGLTCSMSRCSVSQILFCLALTSPNRHTAYLPSLQALWPPCYPWIKENSFQPQGLCTCYSFYMARSPDILMAAPSVLFRPLLFREALLLSPLNLLCLVLLSFSLQHLSPPDAIFTWVCFSSLLEHQLSENRCFCLPMVVTPATRATQAHSSCSKVLVGPIFIIRMIITRIAKWLRVNRG